MIAFLTVDVESILDSPDNLGNLLREDPTRQGLLYFCACFLPAIVLWHSKLYWDSRYINQGDLVHVFAEVATHVALASTVQHVRPVAILSDVKHNVDMFTFSLSILVGNTIYLIRLLEVVFCVKVVNTKGLYEEAYHASKRDLISLLLPSFFYLASAIYSGMEYFGYDATLYNSKGDDLYQNDNHGHRDLAETPSSFYESGSWSGSDVAAWLCLSGSIGSLFIVLFIFGCWSDYAKRSGLDLKTYATNRLSFCATIAIFIGSPHFCYLACQQINDPHEHRLFDSSVR